MKTRSKLTLFLCFLLCMALIVGVIPQTTLRAGEQDDGNTTVATVGDIDGDGNINAKDVTLLRRNLAGGWGVTVNEEDADIDGDGNINAKDVTLLRRFLAGGWGIELREKAVNLGVPVVVSLEESALDSVKIKFDQKITAFGYDDICVYYKVDGVKSCFEMIESSMKNEEVEARFSTVFPENETIYVEYKGELAGSFKSVKVKEDSVASIEIPEQRITAGCESKLRYNLRDKNGVDVKSVLGDVLKGVITAELDAIDPNAYIISNLGNIRMYCGTPNRSYTVTIKYEWYDVNGVGHIVSGSGIITCVPEDPWQFTAVTGKISKSTAGDYVSPDHTVLYSDGSLESITIDETDAVLQVAVQYSRGWEKRYDTPGYGLGLNLAQYPNSRRYISYRIISLNDNIVMLGESYNNKINLVPTGIGTANILVYGVDEEWKEDILGIIPITVTPVRNPALDNLGENYVYENTKASYIVITASDAADIISEDKSGLATNKDAECSMDAPEANVIQIAVPYVNKDGLIYAGLSGNPASDEFSEYVLESSDESIIRLGSINSGKMSFTCAGFGTATISLYGKTGEGEKVLLASKSIKVKRSTKNLPIVKSVSQISLNSLEVVFDADVTGLKLMPDDFTTYYELMGVKIDVGGIQSVTVYEKKAVLKYYSDLIQGEKYYVNFEGTEAGSFEAVRINSDSVAAIVLVSKQINPMEYTDVTYYLYDKNGIDITSALGGTLNGVFYISVKEPTRDTDVLIENNRLYFAGDNRKCTIVGDYTWYDSNGNIHEVKGEAVYYTGNGSVSYSNSGNSVKEDGVPARIEVYTTKDQGLDKSFSRKINSAYVNDSLNILVKAFDCNDNEINGIPVSVEKISTGWTNYYGKSEIITGNIYKMNAPDVSGSGMLHLRLVCGDGSGELTKVLALNVGNEIEAVRYIPFASKDVIDLTQVTEGVSNGLTLSFEGYTKGGFATVGTTAILYEEFPKAGKYVSEYTEFSEFPVRIFLVYKDGKIQSATDLPTFDKSTNTFYDVIWNADGTSVKMDRGAYNIVVYELRVQNDRVLPYGQGAVGFIVK